MHQLFTSLVNGNAAIPFFYTLAKYRHPNIYKHFKILLWIYFIWLVIKYRVFNAPFDTKLNVRKVILNAYPQLEKLSRKVEEADILSFDIFDTLILRRVSDPKDVFDFVGQRLDIINYREKRIFAEDEARRRNKNREPNLSEICSVLEEVFGINAACAYDAELETERTMCIGNPYFKKFLCQEATKGKRIIAVSDMYLPSAFLKDLLIQCGFSVDDIIVSCEEGCSKHSGQLWKIVKLKYNSHTIFHIGDNYCADFKMCAKSGIKCWPVPNVAQLCKNYAGCGLCSTALSLYSSLLNVKFLEPENSLSDFYQYAYSYGGILAYGYCKWIDKMAQENHYDLLLFTARDSEVFFDIYKKLFGSVRSNYLYISRMGAIKCAFESNFETFFDIMFVSKAVKEIKISISDALAQADLAFLENSFSKQGLTGSNPLNESSIDDLRCFLLENKSKIVEAYAAEKEAFNHYISPIINDVKKICVIDLGWRGTVYSLMNDYFKDNYSDVELYGAMVGCYRPGVTQKYVESGKINCYTFSNQHNLNLAIYSEHDVALVEMLYSNSQPSVTGYTMHDDGSGWPVFGKTEEPNDVCFKDMHRGIVDFCDDWRNTLDVIGDDVAISGAEAFSPLFKAVHNEQTTKLFSDISMSLDPNADSVKVLSK